jgi:hypothetical protein
MPGWNPLNMWNPTDYHDDPDCRLAPMYNEVMISAVYMCDPGGKKAHHMCILFFCPLSLQPEDCPCKDLITVCVDLRA